MALFSSATTFLSQGLSRGDKAGTRRVSALLRLTTIGVALSLSVMLLSVTIILGFHRQIHEFAFSQTGHISLNGYGSNWKTSTTPVYVSPELLSFLREEKGVSSVSPLIQQAGLLKTEGDFSGILLYGIDSTFRSRYFTEQVKSGTLPSFSESEYSRPPIVLPSHVARRMNYKVGDAVRIYFFGEKMRVRVFELQAIYESTGLELSPALCPISSLQRLNHWDENTYSRLIIMLQDPRRSLPDAGASHLHTPGTSRSYRRRELMVSTSVRSYSLSSFNWLAFLDTNVYALRSLMVLVGGFAMITGLIIIVLDKSKQIGILKAPWSNE